MYKSRDRSAKCKDIRLESPLLPIYIYKWIPTVEYIPTGTIIGDQARLDISARSVWNMRERAFFDVRILHAPAPTNMNEPIQQMYRAHENESLQCQSYTG
jgi:hypothetical protein